LGRLTFEVPTARTEVSAVWEVKPCRMFEVYLHSKSSWTYCDDGRQHVPLKQ